MPSGFYGALVLIFFASFAAGLLPLITKKAENYIPYFISLASGILIGAALFKLLPESIEINGKAAGLPMLIGFVVFYFPQKYFVMDAHDLEESRISKLGLAAFIGLALHSFTDGIGVGTAQIRGILSHISFAVIIHKIPDALALSLILLVTGSRPKKIVLYLFFFALTTPVGAALTELTLTHVKPEWAGYAAGFSAGNFLAIAFGDIFRKIHKENRSHILVQILLLTAGCLLSLVDFHSH